MKTGYYHSPVGVLELKATVGYRDILILTKLNLDSIPN